MFNRIFIKSSRDKSRQVNIGKLAESLLFYDTTDLMVDKFVITELCEILTIEQLEYLVKEGFLNIHILRNTIGVGEHKVDNQIAYAPFVLSSEALNLSEDLYKVYYQKTGKKSKAKELKRRFLELTSEFKYFGELRTDILDEWNDKQYLSKGLRAYINSYLHQLDTSKFNIELVDSVKNGPIEFFNFDTNLNLEEINEKYNELLPHNLNLNDCLRGMANSRGDFNIATNLESEVYSDLRNNPYLSIKFDDLVQKITKSEKEINTFQDYVLDDCADLDTILKSGEKSFDDFLELLEKSRKFREWLSKADEDSKLITAYYNELFDKSWLEKTPGKVARFTLFGGAGMIIDALAGGIPIGSAITSAIDNTAVDKIAKGWKPNQFVETELKEFLKKKEDDH